MSELKNFKLPDVGEGLTEADIVRWHVRPGDQVSINQIIVEIETAKAVVELPSPYAGVVADLLVPEGATADVGTPIISVQVGGGNGARPAAPAAAPADPAPAPAPIADAPVEGAVEPGMIGSPAPKAERQAVLVGYGVKLGTTSRRQRKQAPQAGQAAAGQSAAPAPSAPARLAPGRVASVPNVPAAPGAAAAAGARPRPRRQGGRACWPSRPCGSWPRTSELT